MSLNKLEKQYKQEIERALKTITAIVERHVLTEQEKYELEMIQDFIKISYQGK